MLEHWADSGQSHVLEAVEAASRRRAFVLTLEHSAVALLAIFGGLILLLLVGTQILNWPWLVLLAIIGLTVTGMRVRQRLVSRYRVAQLVDRRLELSDALSTAWFLLHDPVRRDSGFARAQIQAAARAARIVQPAIVFPLVWRRTWALAGALAAVAFGLFALRYLVTNSLSLKPALIPIPALFPAEVIERLHTPADRAADTKRSEINAGNIAQDAGNGPRAEEKPAPAEGNPSAAAAGKADGNSPGLGQSGTPLNGSKKDGSSGAHDKSASEMQTPGDKDGSKNAAAAGGSAKGDSPSDKTAQNTDGSQRDSSLANRVKDALSGLMDKMRPQSARSKSDASDRAQQDKNSGEQKAGNSAKDSQGEQKAQSSPENQSDGRAQNAQSQSAAQASEKPSGTQSNASDESANRKGSESHSGIGRQDGEKSLKAAEQLRAIGKLDEIIGKRAANLTGDMTVETHSSHQQLQTQYSGRVGHHSDLGGEIDRNEVPMALQNYVREYMEQVRKQADAHQ